MTTIFSKIISKEIPADIIYEDDTVLAFLDIHPINLGHTLIIPKVESVDGIAIDPKALGHIMEVAQKIARVQKKVLGCTGVNYIMNNGADAGQEVFHTHLHVIPRYLEDEKISTPGHDEYKEGESSELAENLASRLS